MCQITTRPNNTVLGKRKLPCDYEFQQRKSQKIDENTPIDHNSTVNLPNTQIQKKPVKLSGCLIAAAQTGNLDRIIKFIESDRFEVDIAETSMGCTPLHYAAYYGHQDIVEYLVEAGAPLDCKNEAGKTPIAWAVEAKNYDIVGYLLEVEADPSIPDNNGISPLHRAVKINDLKMVETLLSINTETEEWTKVNARNNEGLTPLAISAQQGNMEILKLLIEYGANINLPSFENKLTPLHRAVSKGNIEVIQVLIENNAQLNVQDAIQRTPLDLARTLKKVEIINILTN